MAPEIQMVISLVGFSIVVYGFYNSINQKSIMQANKINTLEIKKEYLERAVTNITRRMDEQEKQSQSILLLTEQIKNLSEDVRELKKEFKTKRSLQNEEY